MEVKGKRIPMSFFDLMKIFWHQQLNECQGRLKGKRHRAWVLKRKTEELVRKESGKVCLDWYKICISQNA